MKAYSNLAIIPARSGSKGLRDKNILELCGKPLVAYAIEAAISSGMFREVMVSTDSERYADIARRYGANVPFLRSSEQSGDEAGSWGVVAEVIDGYSKMGEHFSSVCLLQPTSPLREAEDIKSAYDVFQSSGGLPIVSVCEAEHSPLWCARLSDDLTIEGFVEGGHMGRRQDGEKFYRINGAIYIIGTDRFAKSGFSYDEGCRAYVMDQRKSIDIDTEIDFKLAELLLEHSSL